MLKKSGLGSGHSAIMNLRCLAKRYGESRPQMETRSHSGTCSVPDPTSTVLSRRGFDQSPPMI
jgi:hypothetical protein